MDVRLQTLGVPSVAVAGEERRSLPGKPVSFALLVFLGVERELTRDRLIGLFWPESTQDKARHALSQALYDLRKELGEAWVETRGNLVSTTGSLRVDALEFEQLAGEGRNREAVELYRGPFLEGVHLTRTHAFEEWVERQRARLARRHRAAVDAYIGEARGRGDLEEALRCASRWAALDPLDDGAQHALIELLSRVGSRSEALAQYDRYEALLHEDLGLEPLDETRELVAGIREGSVVTPLPLRAPPPSEASSRTAAPAGGSASSSRTDTSTPERAMAVGRSDLPPAAAPRPEGDDGPAPASSPSRWSSSTEVTDRKELGRYLEEALGDTLQVLRPLGRGSMADVYLAREPSLRRLVALKVLSAHRSSDAVARKRFEREAQAAARIHHPNVCTVFWVGKLPDGTPFYVSPFVKGTTMAHRLRAEGRLPADEVRGVIGAVASALSAAHRLGIVHRDVRPGNVLFEENTGRYFLCDFGIAGVLETGEGAEEKLTQTGEVLGHPSYISPEQMQGAPLTDRSDVYSLGVMAHEFLTGHPPVQGGGVGGRSREATGVDLEPLREYLGRDQADLVDLVGRCLADLPAHRPSASDIEKRCEERARASGEAAGPEHGIESEGEADPMRILAERRLPQILLAYLLGGWGILEFTQYLATRSLIPAVSEPLVLLTIPFGFLTVTLLGWFHGKKGHQQMPALEKWMLGVLAVSWLIGVVWVVG